MARLCTVCTHPERAAIDVALTAGGSNRGIAVRYGLARASVDRHRLAHLPKAMSKAEQARDAARADELLSQLRGLQSKTIHALLRAEQQGDMRALLLAVREARENLTLLSRLQAQADDDRLATIEQQLEQLAQRFRPLLRVAP